MSVPAYIWLVLEALTLVIYIVKHGEPRTDFDAIGQTLNAAISLGLLYWGGFFS